MRLPSARLSLRFFVEPWGSEAIKMPQKSVERNWTRSLMCFSDVSYLSSYVHASFGGCRECDPSRADPAFATHFCQMVVVQSTPSTSNPHRKNRRSLAKNKKSRVANQDHEKSSTVPATAKPTADDEEILIDVDGADVVPPTEAPVFGPAPASAGQSLKSETRRIAIPPHRMTPLKKDWINIFGPLTEILGLQVRMNAQRKCVEIRVRLHIFMAGSSC